MKQRIIFHIDVNSAYLSWEAVYRLQKGAELDLREVPSVVGGDPKNRHGIILAKSIPAKKYKIQTGETIYSALQKCPELIIVPPNYTLYMKASNAMLEVLQEYSPLIQRYSVDEVFIDYTNLKHHYGSPIVAAYQIKDRIKKELGFSVNIGISHNKLLAKIASDFKKPDQVHTLFLDEVKMKMWPLPVGDLFGVGRSTVLKLHKMGIETIGDLANYDLENLRHKLKSHGLMIWQHANGIENSNVRPFDGLNMKGIGNSTTIAFDVNDKEIAHQVLLGLCETVGMRLRDAKCMTSLVAISIKNNEMQRYSHQKKLLTTTDCTNTLYLVATQLFDACWKGEPIRHLGVRVGELSSNKSSQQSFFEVYDEKSRELDRVVDNVRFKYGSRSIIRAKFINSEIKPLIGGVGPDDYPMMSSLL